MPVYKIQPLQDSRWPEFLRRHPRSSVFHTAEWLSALQRTYRYRPIVYTTTPPGAELSNGIVFCLIESHLTGRRIVSLPFADHCEPLVDTIRELQEILLFVRNECEEWRGKYIELRPRSEELAEATGFGKAHKYCLHAIDLRLGLDELLRRFHKDSTQRKIRRAERECLHYETGNSELLCDKFYRLLAITRRRHQLPPQPKGWFRNLLGCMGDLVRIRVASWNGEAVASILTFRFKDTMVYKYGCSNTKFNNLGGTALLFWKTIQEAKETGATEFDLGRSDFDNPGLITFKDHWAGKRSVLTYWRSPAPDFCESLNEGWKLRAAKRAFACMPDHILNMVGTLMYRHIG